MNIFDIHSDVWKSLQARRDRLPHALLLVGQKGLGKYALAYEFAASLLCENRTASGSACGQCMACNWFAQGNHPDFRLLQPEALGVAGETEEGKKKPSQQITIDQIRGLDEFLGVGSHRGGLSIVLVNPAEAMNRNAANSILKILEEPPPNILFLLVSGEPSSLLPTIRSRCQTVAVALPPEAVSVAALKAAGIADAERWLALSGGSPRFAEEMAATGQGGWLDLLVARLQDGRNTNPLGLAGELEKSIKDSKGGVQLKQVVEAMQKWLIDLNLSKNGLPSRYFLAQQPKISMLADMIPSVRLINFYRSMNLRRQEAEQPLNARLFLEGIFLDYRALFSTDRG
jgi:DNA polymerase-3 subunit delta'